MNLTVAYASRRVIRTDEQFDCENGQRVYVNGVVLRDSGSYAALSAGEIIAHSSNIGVVCSVPFQPAGTLAGRGRGHAARAGCRQRGNHARCGNGAGLRCPGIARKLGSHVRDFADGGVYTMPTLSRTAPPRRERLLREPTAKAVLGMLELAVEGGTGRAARVDGVRVARKTGTAGVDDAGGQAQSTAYFVGIVPANAPRFVIMVLGAKGGGVACQRLPSLVWPRRSCSHEPETLGALAVQPGRRPGHIVTRSKLRPLETMKRLGTALLGAHLQAAAPRAWGSAEAGG